MTLTPGQAGFLKGILGAVISALVLYVSDPANLTFLSGGAALLVAGLFSSLESFLKSQSGNTTALFGAVSLKR